MLNHAAADRDDEPRPRFRASRLTLAIAFAMWLLAANAASALDGIDLSSPPEPPAEGECPRLIQIKYPFLSCPSGQIGQSAADETWENSRRMPMQSGWVEGDAYWGPSPSTD